jgi:GNAT superfamily N-acetyltransferase
MAEMTSAEVIAAIEANTYASILRWARALGADIHHEPDLTWFASNLSFALCNVVVHASFSATDVERRIDATVRQFAERRTPMCWLIGPSSQPGDLGARLRSRGLEQGEDALGVGEDGLGMAVDLHTLSQDAPTPPGLTIVEVDDGAVLRQWIDVLCEGSGFPDDVRAALHDLMARHGLSNASGLSAHPAIRMYLGIADGEPVATALLFLDAGVAGLYDVATVPHARRKGFGAALSRAALNTARNLGYQTCVLQSSAMGEGVYRRLGFRQYCTFSLYFWSPEQAEG